MKRAVFAFMLGACFSAVGSAQGFTFYYPQIASGTFDGGAWQTTIFITNTSNSFATGQITFTQTDGAPFHMSWIDDRGQGASNGNVITFQLGAGESRKFLSVIDAPLRTGYAAVSASAPVLGTAMFTLLDGGGRMLGEAGVPAAIPLGRQAVFVDTTNGYMTGMAIANPNSSQLEITFELINTAGQKVAVTHRNIPAFQHMAIFIHELFPEAPPIVGRIQFWCKNPMVAVGLRFAPGWSPFTTLPPVAIQ